MMKQNVHFIGSELRKIERKVQVLVYGLILIVAFAPGGLWAQSIVPPSHPDLLVSNDTGDFLRCDVMTTHGAIGEKPLMAFTWSESSIGYNAVKVKIIDATGNSGTVTIPGALVSDVALGDDITDIGRKYIVLVAYYEISTNNAFVAAYRILNVGTGVPLTLVPMYVHQLTNSAPVVSSSLHIDAFADPTVLYGSAFALKRYAVCWSDQNGVNAAWGDFQNPSPFISTSVPNSDANSFTGIATSTEYYGGSYSTPYVYVLYFDNTNNNYVVAKINTLSSTISGTTNLSSDLGELPVIEAMSIYLVPLSASAPWVVAAAMLSSSTGLLECYAFDETNTSGVSYTNGLFPGFNVRWPAIAAGSGLTNLFLDSNYVVGWAVDGNPKNAYTGVFDYINGGVSGVYSDVYQVNTNHPVGLTTRKAVFAMSGSSNTGIDLLSTWVDLSTSSIYYKLSPNVLGFKPTGMSAAQEVSDCAIYPNPANDIMFMKTDGKIESFYLYDILGKQIKTTYSRTSDNCLSVNTSALPAGIYQVRLITEDGMISRKVSVVH